MINSLFIIALSSLLVGVLVAAVLYFRQKQYERPLVWFLALLRALAVALLVFVLIAPLIPQKSVERLKPIIAVLIDNSASMLSGSDSSDVRQNLYRGLQQSLAEGTEAEVVFQRFDGALQQAEPDFSGTETDVDAAIRQSLAQFDSDRLSAIVLASDGIYNRGANPLYAAEAGLKPIYTIAVGDSARQTDFALAQVAAPKYAYRGDALQIDVAVSATALAGETANISVQQNGKMLKNKNITVYSNDFSVRATFVLPTEKPGIYAFDVVVKPHPNEPNTRNNAQRIYVEVLDNKKHILVCSAAPDPDVAAVREALKSVEAYQVDYGNLSKKPESETDLVVLFLQPNVAPQLYADWLSGYSKAIWLVISPDFNARELGRILPGFDMSNARVASPQSVQIQKDFGLFHLSKAAESSINTLPPSVLPSGNFIAPQPFIPFARTGNEVLAAYGNANGRRMAIFSLAGLWQLRMQNFVANKNHQNIDEWLALSAQYLTATDQQNRLQLVYESQQQVGNAVAIQAKVFDAALNPTTAADVRLKVVDARGLSLDFVLNPTEKDYQIDIQGLAAGNYTLKAQAILGNETLTTQGELIIADMGLEQRQTRADFNMLQQLATATNGAFYTFNELAKLPDALNALPTLKPLARISYKAIPLIDLWWLLPIAALLFSAEWGLRRYFGSI